MLLGTHRIDTAQQLSSYKDGLEAQIDQLTAQRKRSPLSMSSLSKEVQDFILRR